jgi:hypothetical protein
MAQQQQQLEALLQAFMGVDNAARKAAEAQWADIKQHQPDALIEALCRILAERSDNAQRQGLRALSAVLMRTLFGIRSNLWFSLQPQTQFAVKAALLQSVTTEPAAHIRTKIVHAIGQLSSIAANEVRNVGCTYCSVFFKI